MKASQAISCFFDYHRMKSQKNTARSYERLISKLCTHFGDRELASLATEGILSFLNEVTKGNKQCTKKLCYSVLSAFFNFVKNSLDPNLQNPCDAVILRKLFKKPNPRVWKILEKEVVDEIIFRTEDLRNRLMLELMSRSGMRVSEVLEITPNDIEEQKIIIREPKSGRQGEVVFVPQKLLNRLKAYIRDTRIGANQQIFPISYTATRATEIEGS